MALPGTLYAGGAYPDLGGTGQAAIDKAAGIRQFMAAYGNRALGTEFAGPGYGAVAPQGTRYSQNIPQGVNNYQDLFQWLTGNYQFMDIKVTACQSFFGGSIRSAGVGAAFPNGLTVVTQQDAAANPPQGPYAVVTDDHASAVFGNGKKVLVPALTKSISLWMFHVAASKVIDHGQYRSLETTRTGIKWKKPRATKPARKTTNFVFTQDWVEAAEAQQGEDPQDINIASHDQAMALMEQRLVQVMQQYYDQQQVPMGARGRFRLDIMYNQEEFQQKFYLDQLHNTVKGIRNTGGWNPVNLGGQGGLIIPVPQLAPAAAAP